MAKLARWIGAIVLSLLLVVVGLWLLSRALGPSDEQEAALALLESPGRAPGENAFAALWLLAYDMPESAQAALVAEDARRFERKPLPDPGNGPVEFASWKSGAEERFKDLAPSAQDWEKFCRARQSGCTARVKADRDGYAALLERHRTLVARASGLRRFGHYRNALPVRMDMPIPNFQYAIAPLTQHALDFANGDAELALTGACGDLTAWRRIGTNSDSLIARMIGIAYATDGYAKLIADMLAELPPEHPLPAACVPAFAAPSSEESLLCEAMKGESAYMRSSIEALGKAPRPMGNAMDFFFPVLFDADMTQARMATSLAYACNAEARAHAKADTPADFASGRPRLGFDCVANSVGCMLADIAAPAYETYARRAQDYSARLRLMGALLWLREHSDGESSLDDTLRKLPPSLVSPGHPIEVADGGRSLRIAQFDATRGAYWQVPLPRPASKQAPAL